VLDRPVGPGVPGWRSWMGTLIEDLEDNASEDTRILVSAQSKPACQAAQGTDSTWVAGTLVCSSTKYRTMVRHAALFSSAELSDPFRDRFKYRCPPLSSYYQPGRIALWTLACRYVGSHTFTATHPPALR
jgi:hypothetical protein